MFHVPGYYRNISQRLSSVLEDVGVSERLVLKRRRTWLLAENMYTIINRMTGGNDPVHYFGSQSEGTTTLGLHSDIDILSCNYELNVIENWADWKAGATNLMIIHNENVSPGYCMLQLLHPDVPQPMTEIVDEHQVKLCEDMVMVKNSWIDIIFLYSGDIKNGPAFSYSQEGYFDQDFVLAFPCKTLPRVVNNWIQTQTNNGKISPVMKRYIENYPCYIVGVGNKCSSHECLEWRISTSHAERCLMLNLNITQIRCYVVMKMILKSLLKHPNEKGLSSFMCKNILLLCIEKTRIESCCASNLLKMFGLCLFELQKCIIHKYCPHFIERRNNLMGRRFSHSVHGWLRKTVQNIIHSNGRALLEITTDDLGCRLQTQLNLFNSMILNAATPNEISREISASLMANLAKIVSGRKREILYSLSSLGKTSWTRIFETLVRISYQESDIAQVVACRLLQPYLFSIFGCVQASSSLQQDDIVSPDALVWLRAGMNSDVASGRLKLASVLYAVRDFDSVYGILRSIEETYDTSLISALCGCYDFPRFYCSERFKVYADTHNELSVRDVTAFCVRFLPSEINCIPRELQYELFRSSQEDLLHRHKTDYWMDWAVVDSLPYLYFLQYKTYGHLRRAGDQQRSLRNLITHINKQDENFGHRETAWNLAGQCMEQEDRPVDAFQCYMNSLNIRPRNNAANFHVCRLLYRVMCTQNAQE